MTGKTRPAKWSEVEQIAICSAYALLLDAQNNELTVNKAELCRVTLPALVNRSRGSYEFKMCNISAALDDNGSAYVHGYKPRSGYQRSLLEIMHKIRPDLARRAACKDCGTYHSLRMIGTTCRACGRGIIA